MPVEWEYFAFGLWSYLTGIVVIPIGLFLFRNQIGMVSKSSWVWLTLLGPIFAWLAKPAVALAQLDPDHWLPVAGFLFLIGVINFHWVMAKLVGDYHPEGFSSSGVLAALVTAGSVAAGLISGELYFAL